MPGIKKLDLTHDDIKFFAQPHMKDVPLDGHIAQRIVVERAVVRKLVQTALAQGYEVTIDYGSDDSDEYEVKRCKDIDKIMDAVCACDEEWLILHHEKSTRKTNIVGNVYLVYGNDGPDVICDYHVSLEGLLGEVCDYAETLYA